MLSDEEEFSGNLYTGHFIGDIRPDIMYHLVEDGVYLPTRMFDYQGICYYKPKEAKGMASRIKNVRDTLSMNYCHIKQFFLFTVVCAFGEYFLLDGWTVVIFSAFRRC